MQESKMALESNTQVIHVTGECRLSFEEEMQVMCRKEKEACETVKIRFHFGELQFWGSMT